MRLLTLLAVLFVFGTIAWPQSTDHGDSADPDIKQVLALEWKMWDAWKAQDVKTIGELTAPEYLSTMGEHVSDYAEELRYVPLTVVKEYKVAGEVRTQRVSQDVILVFYPLDIVATEEGNDISGRYAIASTWAKRNGKWLNVFVHEIPTSTSGSPVAPLKVDHASICGSDLDALRAAFTSIGLAPDYGGPHGNGVTQMALIGFDDGSYLELIAPVKKDDPKLASASDWGKFIIADAGPCAWAVGSRDLAGDVERLKKAGVSVKGPSGGSRKKPDGTTIEWQTAQVGDSGVGAVVPFMIQDKTPRELRVKPSASVKGGPLTGIAMVVIAVKDLDAAVASFRKAYGLGAPKTEDHKDFGAKLAYFEGTPVVLATPLDSGSWLTERLSKFGESPVAYMLWARELASSKKQLRSGSDALWFGKKVGWFDENQLKGARIGIMTN